MSRINKTGAIVLALLLLAARAAADSPRMIAADMARVHGPRDMAWQDCIGADHGGILLRRENQDQLRLAHDELGFRYIRFHGIFADDTDPYREVDGKPVYSFDTIDQIYDAVLRAGMKPFVEISFMPRALATGTKTIFYWNANGSPPKDYGRWADFITAFIRHLETRFGKEEVERWRFEVWNEPNLDGFWTNGDQQAYFRLYDTSVNAIKGVDAALAVGGPATAGAAWVPEFLSHTRSAHSAVDFVTTHTYGVEGGFLDENGEGDNRLSTDPGSISSDVLAVRRKMVDAGKAGLPLYFTEWSTSYNPRDPVHDAYLSAPFILDRLKKSEGAVQSMSYWTYTDLFEEAGPPPSSFHGGFGLINREGIRKAAFFAYRYLNELGPLALENADPQSWLTRDSANFAGLIWNYTAPPDQIESNRPYFRKLHPSIPVSPVKLTVASLAPGTYRLLLTRAGYKANDAYSQYIEWGRPKDLTAEQIAELQRLTSDTPEVDEIVRIGTDGTFARTIAMRTNDVILVRLNRAN